MVGEYDGLYPPLFVALLRAQLLAKFSGYQSGETIPSEEDKNFDDRFRDHRLLGWGWNSRSIAINFCTALVRR